MLTEPEHEAMRLTAELWNDLCLLTGRGKTRKMDLKELALHIHAIQNAILANSAAREYPGQYRMLGGTLDD